MCEVSVIIPTANRQERLGALVELLGEQLAESSEVVVVDQSGEPWRGNQGVARGHAPIRCRYYWRPDISGLTSAKNFGVACSCGDVIVFIDDDVRPQEDFIGKLRRFLDDNPEFGGVCGVEVKQLNSRWRNMIAECFRGGPFRDPRSYINQNYKRYCGTVVATRLMSGGLTAYRRQVFRSYSFDEGLIGYCLGEDVEFSHRVADKWKIGIHTGALAEHQEAEEGRYNTKEKFLSKVAGPVYLFRRLYRSEGYSYAWLVWYMVGVALEAIFSSAKNFDLAPIAGYLAGVRCVAMGFRGCPFIDATRDMSV